MQEFEAAVKMMQAEIRDILDFFIKSLDVLLKDNEKLDVKLIKEYENDKKVLEMFTDYINGKGLIVPFEVSENDKVLMEQTLEKNDKAFIDSNNNNDKEFVSTFDGKHFAFEHYFHKMEDGKYMILLKDKDMSKLKALKEYLDKDFPNNTIDLYKKEIKNLLSIDESKPLNFIDVFTNSYKEIAPILNAYKIPFEVANMEQDMVKIIYERKNADFVNRAIRNSNIDDKEASYYILNSKEFNNRNEAKDRVNEMLNEKPDIDKMIAESKTEKGNEERD